MADSGNDQSKGIIFTWKIKNISCFQGTEFCSPELKGLQNTKWQLKLEIKEMTVFPNGTYTDVKCTFSRLKDMEDLKTYSFTSDMTLLSGKCSSLLMSTKAHSFKIGNSQYGRVRRTDLSLGPFSMHNLTVRYRMWTGDTCPSVFSHCDAVTEFHAQYSAFECSIKQSINGNLILTQSRSHDESKKNPFNIRSSLSETELKFEITLNNDVLSNICTGHIYLKQDREGSLLLLKEAVRPAAYEKGQLWTISLSFNWNDFVSKKKYHFLNDEITLRFELVSSSGQVIYSTSTLTIDGSEDLDITMRKDKVLNFSLLSMLQKGILCDMQLKTATKTFLAHKVVLSAGSSVFRAMFTSDMKEKADNIVEISDIEEYVMERLLHYVYSGDVGELTWDFALKLYYAANKYQMDLLKNECSVFLSANLSLNNICEALVFSDKHNDSYMQQSVQNFIARNTADVLNSKGWKDFVKVETMWALNILSQIYKI